MLLRAQLLLLLLRMTTVLAAGEGASSGTESTQSDSTSATDTNTDDSEADDGDDDPDSDDNSAGGDGGETGRVQGTSFERGFTNLMERFGNNARRVAEHLYRQDYKHRESLRLARGEVETLKTRIPKDGSRVVDRTTARELIEYRKFGKPSELQSKLQAGVDAATKLQGREKDDVLRDIAEVTGWNYKALKGAAADLDYTIKEVDDGRGGKKKVAHVVTRNGADATPTETPATDWFSSNRDYLLPSLTANSGNGGGSTYGQQFIQQPVTQQRSNGSTQPQSAAAAVLSRYDEPKAK